MPIIYNLRYEGTLYLSKDDAKNAIRDHKFVITNKDGITYPRVESCTVPTGYTNIVGYRIQFENGDFYTEPPDF